MDNLLRLRLLRYRQTPNVLKRVKAHAIKRELSTSVLVINDFGNSKEMITFAPDDES